MADQEHSTPPSPNEENHSTSEEEEQLPQQSSPEQHDDDHDDEAEEQNSSDSPKDDAEPNLQANPTAQTPNESSSESPESAQSKEETEEEEEEEEEVSLSPADQQQQQEEQKQEEPAVEPEEKEEKEGEEAEPELSPGESTDSSAVDETPVEPVDDGHPFHLVTSPSNQQDETPEEQKSQRDLDDDEIPPPPPALLAAARNSFSSEKRLSQSSQPPVANDDHEDVVEEKENVDPSQTNGEIHLEKLSFEEIEKKEVEVSNEVLPPLEPTSMAQELLHDPHFVDETITTTTTATTTTVEAPAEKKEEECPWEDVLSNRTLMKKTIRKGGTNSRPTRSQQVTVNYSLALRDEKSGETTLIEEKRNEEFFVGETDIIAAIDLAVQSMDEGELASLVADVRHVYGNEGFAEKGIPPKNDENDYKMEIQLELLQFRPAPNVELLSADERILWAEKKRQNGNVHYRRKEYSSSLQCYRGSLRFLDLENNPLRHDSTDDDRTKIVDQFIQVQNNVAQVNLTLKRYDLCLNAVENVLRIDRTNIKALFRQGKSLFELGQYDRCQTPLKSILQLDPNHSDRDQINKMIAFAEQKLINYKQNEKDIYRRMFQGNASPPTTTTTNAAGTSKTPRKIVLKKSNSSDFWTYVGLGTVTVSLVGLFAYLKYRRAS